MFFNNKGGNMSQKGTTSNMLTAYESARLFQFLLNNRQKLEHRHPADVAAEVSEELGMLVTPSNVKGRVTHKEFVEKQGEWVFGRARSKRKAGPKPLWLKYLPPSPGDHPKPEPKPEPPKSDPTNLADLADQLLIILESLGSATGRVSTLEMRVAELRDDMNKKIENLRKDIAKEVVKLAASLETGLLSDMEAAFAAGARRLNKHQQTPTNKEHSDEKLPGF
jgi:hypothetical protein